MKAKLIFYTSAVFFFWAYFSILKAIWSRLMPLDPRADLLAILILITVLVPLSLLSASFLTKKITNKSV